jgi:hypothetical protein
MREPVLKTCFQIAISTCILEHEFSYQEHAKEEKKEEEEEENNCDKI